MALIEHTLEGKIDRVDVAIGRIRSFDPLATGLMDTPYYVAYSGGKDSDALRILFELAGVRHELVHNHTTVDAPETVYYVRSIPGIQIDYPKTSMWRLIVKNQMPPTRLFRYCCSKLKERSGHDRLVVTGVRWAESVNRANKRSGLEIQRRKLSESIMLNSDNDADRRLFETCTLQGKRILNPIIDWADEDVWELLNYYGCKSNPLYQCGFARIGCIGCPLAKKERIMQFERYPKYKDNYIRAFGQMIRVYNNTHEKQMRWQSGEEVFDWWMSDKAEKDYVPEGQLSLFDEGEQEGRDGE